MSHLIASIFNESSALKSALASDAEFIAKISYSGQKLIETIRAGGTIYSCGNGGSSCDAMHLSEELVARYKSNRPGIRAMHFSDPGVLTCWGNDIGFSDAFARYASTFCTSKDVLIAISTSGRSENVINAIGVARSKGTYVIGLTGKDGGKMAPLCDTAIIVPSNATERIQEVHITCIHAWCEMIEGANIPVSN